MDLGGTFIFGVVPTGMMVYYGGVEGVEKKLEDMERHLEHLKEERDKYSQRMPSFGELEDVMNKKQEREDQYVEEVKQRRREVVEKSDQSLRRDYQASGGSTKDPVDESRWKWTLGGNGEKDEKEETRNGGKHGVTRNVGLKFAPESTHEDGIWKNKPRRETPEEERQRIYQETQAFGQFVMERAPFPFNWTQESNVFSYYVPKMVFEYFHSGDPLDFAPDPGLADPSLKVPEEVKIALERRKHQSFSEYPRK